MQVRHFLIVFALLLIGGIYFWYGIEKSCKTKNFTQEVEYSMTLLTAIENNKTKTAKYLLSADIDRLFVLIANGDKPQKYFSLCRIMDEKNIQLLKKFTMGDKKIINIFPDINKTNNLVKNGMRLFSDYCQKRGNGR